METLIKTSDEGLAGMALNVPFIGKIIFDENCIAKTNDAEGAKQLAEVIEHISVVNESKGKKTSPAKAEKVKPEPIKEILEETVVKLAYKEVEDPGPSIEEMIDYIKTLNFNELNEMATQEYPKEKRIWGKIKSKKKFCEYIAEKLKE
tara:strand:- start:358 stop:801 length:444 start_codon:yes stop_codon:yes gene_type:complete